MARLVGYGERSAVSLGSNITSLKAQRQLNIASRDQTSSAERLSSGLRINRASDDAAGLSVASSLSSRTRVFTQALRNGNDGMSSLAIADDGLSQMTDILHRLKELATSAATGTVALPQRLSMNKEAAALVDEYNRIVSSTRFNGRTLLDGSVRELVLQIGYGTEGTQNVGLTGALRRNVGTGAVEPTGSPRAIFDANQQTGLTADFNGDGRSDSVYLTATLGLLRYLGAADGSYGTETVITSTVSLSGTTGDFNGDGRADLALGGNGSVSIMLGNGNGTFKAATTVATVTGQVISLQVGDVNGDGRDDLLGLAAGNSISSILGNGDGTFAAAKTTALGSTYGSLTVGDVNGDGRTDAAVSSPTSIRLLTGGASGALSFLADLTPSGGVTTVELGDMNGDGLDDLVTGNSTEGFRARLGNGNGTFAAGQVVLSDSADDAELADLNGDGHLDLVMAGNTAISVSFGNGNGSFQASNSIDAGLGSLFLSLGDFNGDGVTDAGFYDNVTEEVNVAVSTTTQVSTIGRLDITSRPEALVALSAIDAHMSRVSGERGIIGAAQSRLSSALSTLAAARENYQAAEARITDADIADEAARLTTKQILQQSASAVLAQANQLPALTLMLLRNG